MRTLLLLIFLSVVAATSAKAQPAHSTGAAQKSEDIAFADPHRITFTPIGMVVAYGQVNPTVSLSYEYIFNRKAGLSVYVPFVFGYNPPNDYIGYNGYSRESHTSLHAAPGIRFHTGERRAFHDFATGVGVLVGNMHFKPGYDYSTQYIPAEYNYTLTGIVCDNSINVQRGHFLFGFDARVGALKEKREGSQFFIALGMHFGAKF